LLDRDSHVVSSSPTVTASAAEEAICGGHRVAIATGILVVGSLMLFVGTAPGTRNPKWQPTQTIESDTAPSPTMVNAQRRYVAQSCERPRSNLGDRCRPHSGTYFSNTFEDSYPKAAEIGMMKGMIRATDGDPTMSDVTACSLSYVEGTCPSWSW
jgi:hypothetical protein